MRNVNFFGNKQPVVANENMAAQVANFCSDHPAMVMAAQGLLKDLQDDIDFQNAIRGKGINDVMNALYRAAQAQSEKANFGLRSY